MADPSLTVRSLRAPAKLNLGLRVGPVRDDGLHELRSLFCPLELADRVRVSPAEADTVLCPAVEGPNLATAALVALREAGWQAPPVRIEIDKRVPIAAGLGGGSADAAAVLRLARGEVKDLRAIAHRLGSDVPSQLEPRPCIVAGTGELVKPLELAVSAGIVLIPAQNGLSAAEVYAEADRIAAAAGHSRSSADLDAWERELRLALDSITRPTELAELIENDLEPAAVGLAPEAGEALAKLRDAGAEAAFVCGSGPTVAGLFAGLPEADEVATALSPGLGGVLVTALDTSGLDQ